MHSTGAEREPEELAKDLALTFDTTASAHEPREVSESRPAAFRLLLRAAIDKLTDHAFAAYGALTEAAEEERPDTVNTIALDECEASFTFQCGTLATMKYGTPTMSEVVAKYAKDQLIKRQCSPASYHLLVLESGAGQTCKELTRVGFDASNITAITNNQLDYACFLRTAARHADLKCVRASFGDVVNFARQVGKHNDPATDGYLLAYIDVELHPNDKVFTNMIQGLAASGALSALGARLILQPTAVNIDTKQKQEAFEGFGNELEWILRSAGYLDAVCERDVLVDGCGREAFVCVLDGRYRRPEGSRPQSPQTPPPTSRPSSKYIVLSTAEPSSTSRQDLESDINALGPRYPVPATSCQAFSVLSQTRLQLAAPNGGYDAAKGVALAYALHNDVHQVVQAVQCAQALHHGALVAVLK